MALMLAMTWPVAAAFALVLCRAAGTADGRAEAQARELLLRASGDDPDAADPWGW